MSQDPSEISISLLDLLRFLARGAVIAIVMAAAVGAAAFFLSRQQPTVFRAEATVLMARAAGLAQFGLTPVTAPPIDMSAYRVALASDQVLIDALARLGVDEPTARDVQMLRARTGSSVESGVRDPSMLRVEGRGASAVEAVTRANAVAQALVAWDRRRARESIDRAIATLELQIEALSEQVRSLQAIGDATAQSQIDGLVRLRAEQQQQLAYARALVAAADGLLSVLQPADATARQVAPRPATDAALAALLAVVAAYALLLLRMAVNTRLSGSDDIARVTGLEVLSEFPTVGRHQGTRLREAAGYLRTSLLFATEDVHPRVFMVTSALEGEGKSTVARHLAEGFVGYGYRTLLVDADLRDPSVIEAYEVDGPVPMSASTESWLLNPSAAHKVLTVTLDGENRLDVIPQGRAAANAPELLGRGFRAALNQWLDYDVVVIDTAPILAVSDALAVAPHCTGTVVVVDRRRSDRRKLASAIGVLRRVGVRVLGIVANNVGSEGSGGGYGTQYGGGDVVRPTVFTSQVPAHGSRSADRS